MTALSIPRPSPSEAARMMRGLAEHYEKRGDHEEAKHFYDRAAEIEAELLRKDPPYRDVPTHS